MTNHCLPGFSCRHLMFPALTIFLSFSHCGYVIVAIFSTTAGEKETECLECYSTDRICLTLTQDTVHLCSFLKKNLSTHDIYTYLTHLHYLLSVNDYILGCYKMAQHWLFRLTLLHNCMRKQKPTPEFRVSYAVWNSRSLWKQLRLHHALECTFFLSLISISSLFSLFLLLHPLSNLMVCSCYLVLFEWKAQFSFQLKIPGLFSDSFFFPLHIL